MLSNKKRCGSSANVLSPHAGEKRVSIWVLAVVIAIHAVSICAFLPYAFVWWGIPLVLLGNFVFGSLGINLGFHRMLTHKSVSFPLLLERMWILFGVCCLEGSPLWWVCTHRHHHRHSDSHSDPHSPINSFYWGHMQWIYTRSNRHNSLEIYENYAYDLARDPFIMWLHRHNRWAKVYALHVLLIVAFSYMIGFINMGAHAYALKFTIQVLLWGVFVRTVYVWHVTWLVNSAAHRWGYRNYSTSDKSYNNPFVALLTNGEGWHNNHHAFPRACSHGHRLWEIDLTFIAVQVMQNIGLAKRVVTRKSSNTESLTFKSVQEY